MIRRPPKSTLFPDPTLFRSSLQYHDSLAVHSRRTSRVISTVVGPSIRSRPMRVLLAPRVAPKDLRYHLEIPADRLDRKSTRLNSSHANISYAVFCLKKKINE